MVDCQSFSSDLKNGKRRVDFVMGTTGCLLRAIISMELFD